MASSFIGNIEAFAAIAPKIWQLLGEAEAHGCISLMDVELSNSAGGLTVKARLDENAAPTLRIVEAMRAIASFLNAPLDELGPYRSIAFPSGSGMSLSALTTVDGVSVRVRALLDGGQYTNAIAEALLVEVAA